MSKVTFWESIVDADSYQDILDRDYSEVTDVVEQLKICLELKEEEFEFIKDKMSVKEYEHPIICIADLDLWKGKKTAYRIIGDDNGCSLSDIFTGPYYGQEEFYLEDGELKCRDPHHDGTNYYMFRALNCDEDQAAELLDNIAWQKDFNDAMEKYSESIAKDVEYAIF